MTKLLNKPTPTVNELAKKYGVSALVVKKQLLKGIKVEKEHTNNVKIAREIALDHIGEKLNYYTLLAKIEEETITEAAAKKKAPAKKPAAKKPAAAKEEGGSSFNEVMGRVYERATVLGVHAGTGASKSKDKKYLEKIAELQKKQAADLKLLPAKIRESALKAAERSSSAYLKSLKENHGVDPKEITEVHHTNKGIGGLIGRNVATRDNPHDLVVRIGGGKNSRLHGASLKKTQGTLGNNSHVQFSAHGKEVGIGHDVANIWNAGLERAKLNGLSKAELKARREDKKVIEHYKKTQQEAINHHTESFNAASTEMQRKHLRHLMKLNFDPDVPYDYVNGEKGYAKPIEQMDHAKAVASSSRFAAVSRGTSSHIYDDQGRHILTVEHRATHGPFSSMQANAKLGSLKPPKGEAVTMPRAPSHPLAHDEASRDAAQVAPEKIKKLLGDVRQARTPASKAREMKRAAAPTDSPIASMPRPGIQRQPAPNYNKLISSVPKLVQGIAKSFSPQPMNEEIGTGGIRGLGFVTGDPGVSAVDQYINTNAMSYDDLNGNILKMIRDKHSKHLKNLGFNEFSPNDLHTQKNTVLNELGEYDNKGGTTGVEGLTDAPPAPPKKTVKEGYAIIGRPFTRFGDVNPNVKFSGNKPKPTTTKNDEKDDTYKNSKQGGRVKVAKPVKSGQIDELSSDTVSNYVTGAASQLASGELASNRNKEQNRITGIQTGVRKLHPDMYPGGAKVPVNEVSAELVGKVHNRYLEKGKPVPPMVQRAVKKKWLESNVGKAAKKTVKEDATTVAATQHMDTAQSGYHQSAKPSRSRVNLRGTTAHVKGAEYRSGTGSARASFGAGGQLKADKTNVPTRFMRSVKNAPSTQGAGGQLKPSSTSGSSSFTPNSQSRSMNVGKGMAASKQTSPVVKGMSAAGQEASKKIVPKAASVIGAVGKAARALSGPEGAAVTAAGELLGKKAASSHKAGHQSFTPHGSEGEKSSTVFNRMKQPEQQKPQGRSISDYEDQVLKPKSYEAPKAPENPKVDAPTPPSRPDYFSRGQAFGAARGEAGGGSGKFSYDNKDYQTNVSGEPYKPASQLKQTSVKEETKMDTKELVNEALDCILEDNLSEMKDNLMLALQEKTMEKLEERKKEIAANYFAE